MEAFPGSVSGGRSSFGRTKSRQAVVLQSDLLSRAEEKGGVKGSWERAPSALAFHRRTGEQKAQRGPQRFAMTQAVERLEVQRQPGNPAQVIYQPRHRLARLGFQRAARAGRFGAAAPEQEFRALSAQALFEPARSPRIAPSRHHSDGLAAA